VPNLISAGALPQNQLGSLQCSPDLLSVFKGPTSKGKGKGMGKEGKENGGERMEGKGSSPTSSVVF